MNAHILFETCFKYSFVTPSMNGFAQMYYFCAKKFKSLSACRLLLLEEGQCPSHLADQRSSFPVCLYMNFCFIFSICDVVNGRERASRAETQKAADLSR
jgi:hypothetical protein